MSAKRLRIVAILVVLTASVAIAGVLLNLTATTPDPHIVGNTIGFQVTWDGSQPQFFDWSWRSTCGGGQGPWSGATRSFTPLSYAIDSCVGSYDERCVGTSYPGPTISTVVTNFTTVGPTGDVLTQGQNAESYDFPVMKVLTKWQVRHQATKIGGSLSGILASNRTRYFGSQNWDPWVPDPEQWFQGMWYYENSTAEICELKWIDVSGWQVEWNAIPIGAIVSRNGQVYDFEQQNRVKLKDWSNNWVTFELSVHRFRARKVSATSWRFESLD